MEGSDFFFVPRYRQVEHIIINMQWILFYALAEFTIRN